MESTPDIRASNVIISSNSRHRFRFSRSIKRLVEDRNEDLLPFGRKKECSESSKNYARFVWDMGFCLFNGSLSKMTEGFITILQNSSVFLSIFCFSL